MVFILGLKGLQGQVRKRHRGVFCQLVGMSTSSSTSQQIGDVQPTGLLLCALQSSLLVLLLDTVGLKHFPQPVKR